MTLGCGRAPSASATTQPQVAAPVASAIPVASAPRPAAAEPWEDLSDLESPMRGTKRDFRALSRASREGDPAAARDAARGLEGRLADLVARSAAFRGETPDDFRAYAVASLAAARAARCAAEANDPAAGLSSAHDDLDRSCTTCHGVYREEE